MNKKIILMNHIEDTTDQVEKFIREETLTPPNNGDSDYLSGYYYLIVEIVKK